MSYRRATARCSTRGQPRPQVAPPSGWLRCRAAREPGSLYPRPRTATLRVATLPRLFRPRSSLGEPTPPDEPDCCSKTAIVDRAPLRRPPRKAGAARHAKTGICSDKPAGVSRETAPSLPLLRQTIIGRAPGLSSPHGGPSPPPATGPQHSLRSFAPAQATDRKTAPPNSHCPRALRFILHSAYAEVVESLLRRGARGLRGLRSRAAAQLRLR